MPLFAPNPLNDTTSGASWSPYYTGPRYTTRTTGPAPNPSPQQSGQKSIQQQVQEQIDAYNIWSQSSLGQNTMAADESATAYARKQGDAAMKNEKDRLDAYVADLQSSGRYRDAEIVKMQGEAKLARDRFEWEQAVKQQELGLSRAEAYARFASSPDMMFARNDLMAGLGRAGQGLGPQPYGSTGTPHMKTYSDFEAIAGPGGSLSQGGPSAGGASTGAGGGTSSGSAGAGGGAATDQRFTAATNVMKAAGMSPDYGTDANDSAAISAIENIFKMRKPGSYESLRPGQQAGFAVGLSRRGYYAPDAITDMLRAGIGQGSARAA